MRLPESLNNEPLMRLALRHLVSSLNSKLVIRKATYLGMKKKTPFFLLLSLILSAASCRPCGNTTARGNAQMETLGQYYSAPGAAVTFIPKGNAELRYETWTNSDGNYEITLPPGLYRVHGNWSGYPLCLGSIVLVN